VAGLAGFHPSIFRLVLLLLSRNTINLYERNTYHSNSSACSHLLYSIYRLFILTMDMNVLIHARLNLFNYSTSIIAYNNIILNWCEEKFELGVHVPVAPHYRFCIPNSASANPRPTRTAVQTYGPPQRRSPSTPSTNPR